MGNLRAFLLSLLVSAFLSSSGRGVEVTWSVLHPVAIDPAYMERVVAAAVDCGGVDSFEICGLEQLGVNALVDFGPYPRAAAKVDGEFVRKTRAALNASIELAHAAGKKVYFWHRENLVPPGIFGDVPQLLDENGELDLLGKAYNEYLSYKIRAALEACPGLDGLVLTLTESQYSVLHNSNKKKYPPVETVANLVGVVEAELHKHGKRLILRSFGVGTDHDNIIAGGKLVAERSGRPFEIETKVTEADFVPWLPKNPYLKTDAPLTLGAECDALGEYLGAGRLPAAQVERIGEYVQSARESGASRFAIRIDRGGRSLLDSPHRINLYAYMRYIGDSTVRAEQVLTDYCRQRYGRAGAQMKNLFAHELEMIRSMLYVKDNLVFHTPRRGEHNFDFRYLKAGGIFSLFREGWPLSAKRGIWSVFTEQAAPTHAEILAEKERACRLAENGLTSLEALRSLLPEAEFERQRVAFQTAVSEARAYLAWARCTVAYFEDMARGADDPKALREAVEAAKADREMKEICRGLLREYAVERKMRKEQESSGAIDFVIPGGIYDNVRVECVMHSCYAELKGNDLWLTAGWERFPDGTLTLRLKGPESARVEVGLASELPQSCSLSKQWADGIWTVTIGKRGTGYPGVRYVRVIRKGAESSEAP